MRLYLDDDLASVLLARLLRNAGHDVEVPLEVSRSGSKDAVHLIHAIQERRVCLSGNYKDFAILHNLIVVAQGSHPGIIVVRRDNDPTRDLTPRGIVGAIRNLIAAQVALSSQFLV